MAEALHHEAIPYGRQSVDEADIARVVEVLRSDFLTQGPVVPAFEDAVAAQCGARHAVAVNSATSALHLACMALGVGSGDSVWTSPLTFVASSNAALYCGARVDFVDVDARTYNMCPQKLAAKLDEAAARGDLPKVIIPVHLTGQPCDMAAIHKAASRHGVRIIEDASHAIGAHFACEPIGNCAFSDIAVFSFHPVKIITSGEGGMALTNDDALAHAMRMDRSHGITRDEALMEAGDPGGWHYEQQRLGYNYRMADMNAALGLAQLEKLGAFIERRRAIAARYDEAFAASSRKVAAPYQHDAAFSSYHLYVVRVPEECHRAVFDFLRGRQIGVNLHYIPVYLQPFYRGLGFAPGLCPEAERYHASAISLPIYPAMGDSAQARVIEALDTALAS